jgi:hypothetical protein
MTICINCGVELDDGLRICPLCGKNQGNDSGEEHFSNNLPSDIIQVQKKENRKHLWELSGIIAFSGITVCTIVDLLVSKGLRWSLFSDVPISAAWIILTLFLFAYKRTFLLIASTMFTILAALFLIDVIDRGAGWFFPVCLPLTIAAFIVVSTIIILYKAAHFKGLNIIAAALIILNDVIRLRWSLIAAVSILPVALIFFFYHYRLKKGNRLDSFFHI